MERGLAAVESLVLELIAGARSFDEVRVEVERYQRARIARLDRFWGSGPWLRGVPTDAFRTLRMATDEGEIERTFETSGTTQASRGVCERRSTRAYAAGARRQFAARIGDPAAFRWVSLVPSVEEAPRSSLAFMVALLSEESPRTYAWRGGSLDGAVAVEALARASEQGAPVMVFGTAFALAALSAEVDLPALPDGSWVIDTGGFKGQRVAVDAATLRGRLAERLSVAASRVVTEYSMTELSSQLYGRDLLVAPPWCRVTAVDPDTLAPLGEGEEGLLHFLDLANVDVPCAIQTSDLGVVTPGGVVLRGRAPGATPRGCSLDAERLLETSLARRGFT